MSLWLALSFLLTLHMGAQGFGILPGDSLDHLEITERAILNVTVQVCHDLAVAEGASFTFPSQPYTAENVAVACDAQKSTKSFRQAILLIILMNVRVDIRHALNASFHFDDEMFIKGRGIIAEGIRAVKATNELGNYEASRKKLGETFHPLQDFYSHSNWVELGFLFPNLNLMSEDASIGNIADIDMATCRSCDGDDCSDNILEAIIEGQYLTSGYFSVVPFASKPAGKCSHGGAVDRTSTREPTGGINKDTFGSDHGFLHTQAAVMATAATSALLEDIRKAAGDRPFLQMLGLSKGSNKDLCFVIDTTNSMRDVIAAVRSAMSAIINSVVGTDDEPAAYILVPFNDPDVGPLIKTTDPGVIQVVGEALSISGGGDEGELSLSGLELALRGAPFNSEVFLFTDAPAKDKQLKNSVLALIERTQTEVNFMIISTTTTNRRRRRDTSQPKTNRLTDDDIQLYRELSQASGGLTAEVTESELPAAVSIVSDTLNTSLVTLIQAARNPGREDDFFFFVDETLTNPTVYITGRSVQFTLTSPTGESQQSTDTTGSLITSSQSVGNLQALGLRKIAGLWEITMNSANPYTLKVIGESPIDFLFEFVEDSTGPLQGYDALESRPRSNVNGSLLMSLSGSNTAEVTEVDLVNPWSSEEIEGVVRSQGSGNFIVQINRIPTYEFAVRVKGQDETDTGTTTFFQRQSSIIFRSSNLTITADSTDILDPTAPFSVPFSVTTHGEEGDFTIRATNSRLFTSTFPSTLSLTTGSTANGTVTLEAPRNTPSGTDITLTIEAESPSGVDTNYVILRFTVINPITDFIKPECVLLSLQSNCSENCSLANWTVSARVRDEAEGSGVDSVSLAKGNGTLITNPAVDNGNETLVFYVSPCCSPAMELLVIDKVGNAGTCYYSSRDSSPSPISMSTKITQPTLLCLSLLVLWVQILTEQSI